MKDKEKGTKTNKSVKNKVQLPELPGLPELPELPLKSDEEPILTREEFYELLRQITAPTPVDEDEK